LSQYLPVDRQLGGTPCVAANKGSRFMSFAESIRTCLRKYATFSGRARRSEFWWFHLFYAICLTITTILIIAINSALPAILILGLVLPELAVTVRRLHGSGRSGGWILLGLIPYVGVFFLIGFACQSSVPVTTKHGPPPQLGTNPPAYAS
jgi:uncharacterized membrane protein YhaH (DUF805 family)